MCFYNASKTDELKTAMVDILSDMLSSFISKTRIATTTAISLAHNYDSSKNEYNNGYYNVYSGYEITLGQVRRTSLQRETFACDHDTGEFYNDENQYLNIARRLQCRITDCDIKLVSDPNNPGNLIADPKDKTAQEFVRETGYKTKPTPCAPHGVSSATQESSISNSCITDRYIFTGDYSQDRYALDPHIVSLLDEDSHGNVLAGFIKNGHSSSTTDGDYHFLVRDESEDASTCEKEMSEPIKNFQDSAPNYLLSPYECGSDFDCGMKDEKTPRYCEFGRCVDKNVHCTSAADGKICIGKHEYKKSNACSNHNECVGKCDTEGGCVCHAGACVAGTVKGCDIRQFIATQPLGTIEYATPVPVVPPTRSYSNHSYKEFSKKYWQRDTLLLAGANDGMLHAFILGDNGGAAGYQSGLYAPDIKVEPPAEANEGDDGVEAEEHHGDIVPGSTLRSTPFAEGDELWGFIPKAVMPNLQKLTKFGPQRHVNATPVTADVRVPDYDGAEADSWRTVVVGGFRNGGRGYYALDVTNPGNPKILWEIDNQWQPSATPAYPDMNAAVSSVYQQADWTNRNNHTTNSGAWYPFQLLGQSYPEPAITNLVINGKVEPVVIIAGGESATSQAGDRTGHVLYIVRLFPKTKSDLLVKAFYFENAVTGTPAVFPNNFNSIAQLIYVGDAKGALFRLDLAKANVADWGSNNKLDDAKQNGTTIDGTFKFEAPVFDPSNSAFKMGAVPYERITYKPAVSAYKNEGNNILRPIVQITFGTGSNDNFSINETERNYVANFYDMYDATNAKYQLNATGGPFVPEVYVFNPPSGVGHESVTINGAADSQFGKQTFQVRTHDPGLTGANVEPFSARQKMTGAAVTHNFISYFPTFIADASSQKACATGGAAIWKIGTLNTAAETERSQRVTTDNIMNTQNDTSLFENGKRSLLLSPGTKVYGLEITNQLYCLTTKAGKQSMQIAPQLIAQTGVETAGITSATDGSKNLRPSSTDINTVAINLDAIQPEMSQSAWASVYE